MNNPMSLVEKAKTAKNRFPSRSTPPEHIELALAYALGQVSLGQCAFALGSTANAARSAILAALTRIIADIHSTNPQLFRD